MLPLIDSHDTKLNHGNAYWMMRISKAVHHDKPDNSPDENAILNDLREEDPGFRKVTPVSEDNAQAILVEHEKYLCIAFRGSDEKRDYLDNIDIRSDTVSYGGIELEFHKGFYRSFSKVWKNLEKSCEERIQEAKKEGVTLPLFFAGHSLGGAMATIATAIWVFNGERQFASTYTFGQPAGNKKQKLLEP